MTKVIKSLTKTKYLKKHMMGSMNEVKNKKIYYAKIK